MSSRILTLLAFFAMTAVLAAQAAYFIPRLPERVATHFDAAGAPNGWGSPTLLARDVAMMVAFFATTFLAIGLIDLLPVTAIRVSGGRKLDAVGKKAVVAYVRDWARWFLILTMALLALAMGRVFQANLSPAPRVGAEMFWFLGAYLAAAGAMLIALIRRLGA
jgi:uncharacterized membrane protein